MNDSSVWCFCIRTNGLRIRSECQQHINSTNITSTRSRNSYALNANEIYSHTYTQRIFDVRNSARVECLFISACTSVFASVLCMCGCMCRCMCVCVCMIRFSCMQLGGGMYIVCVFERRIFLYICIKIWLKDFFSCHQWHWHQHRYPYRNHGIVWVHMNNSIK